MPPMSPGAKVKSAIVTLSVTGPLGSFDTSVYCLGAGCPPWLLFSGRCPWVRTGLPASTRAVNGSVPVVPSVAQMTAIPIDSYHDARTVSYVTEIESVSPFLTATRQSGGVAVIDTSHDTAP